MTDRGREALARQKETWDAYTQAVSMVLEPTKVQEKHKILAALERLLGGSDRSSAELQDRDRGPRPGHEEPQQLRRARRRAALSRAQSFLRTKR